MLSIFSLRTALVLGAGCMIYLFVRLYQVRRTMRGLPQPPGFSFLLGHIVLAAECERHFPANVHPHVYANFIRKKYNLGKVFYVDWWPLGPRQCYVADPELVSQYVTTTQSLPKSPLVADFLHKLLGRNNMVTLEGNQWRMVRSMFNPGFSTAHLMTLVPFVVDQSVIFCDVMREKAETGELFEMEEYATRLTCDIIGKVVLDSNFDSQKVENAIVSTFRKQVAMLPPTGINPLAGLDPRRTFRLWSNGRKLDRLIGEELDKRIANRGGGEKSSVESAAAKGTKKDRKRSIVDLALEAYQNESGSNTSSSGMDASFRRSSIDSIKTFIFAGHDTTSSTIAYIYYFMHLYPECQQKLAEELDAVFGKDLTTTADQLRANPYLVNKLDYTTAVIKETLRIFPPASTLRDVSVGDQKIAKNLTSTITDPDTGAIYPMKDFTVWPVVGLVHRNEAFFPEPTSFIPTRFLPDQTPFPDALLFTPAGKDAWRPFEKGPRNCIGQELAMLETKVILALTIREFDFTAEFDGVKAESIETCYSVDEKVRDGLGTRSTVEGHMAYQILKGSAKPVGGMPGRIRVR